MNRHNERTSYGSESILNDNGGYMSLSVKIHRMTKRGSCNVNYRLWVTIMCWCSFTNCKKCTTLVRNVNNGDSYARVGRDSVWEMSVSFLILQFCYEAKTTLKKNTLLTFLSKGYPEFIFLNLPITLLLCLAFISVNSSSTQPITQAQNLESSMSIISSNPQTPIFLISLQDTSSKIYF